MVGVVGQVEDVFHGGDEAGEAAIVAAQVGGVRRSGGVGGTAWIEGTNQEDGAGGTVGELREAGQERRSCGDVPGVGVAGRLQDVGEGIDDDEAGVVTGDGGFQDVEVGYEGEGPVVEGGVVGVETFDGAE